MTVYKVVEVVGTSNTGFSDAVRGAVERASRTIQDLRWIEVKEFRGRVDKGRIAEFQAKVQIAFTLHAAKAEAEHGDATRYAREGPTRQARSMVAQRASAQGVRGGKRPASRVGGASGTGSRKGGTRRKGGASKPARTQRA